jgi:hypothetical protein
MVNQIALSFVARSVNVIDSNRVVNDNDDDDYYYYTGSFIVNFFSDRISSYVQNARFVNTTLQVLMHWYCL